VRSGVSFSSLILFSLPSGSFCKRLLPEQTAPYATSAKGPLPADATAVPFFLFFILFSTAPFPTLEIPPVRILHGDPNETSFLQFCTPCFLLNRPGGGRDDPKFSLCLLRRPPSHPYGTRCSALHNYRLTVLIRQVTPRANALLLHPLHHVLNPLSTACPLFFFLISLFLPLVLSVQYFPPLFILSPLVGFSISSWPQPTRPASLPWSWALFSVKCGPPPPGSHGLTLVPTSHQNLLPFFGCWPIRKRGWRLRLLPT